MGQKNRAGYTAAEERFVAKYREALRADDDRIAKAKRPVDYSFLDTIPTTGTVKRSRRFLKVACVLLGIFIVGSGLAVWINSEPANAGRFAIEKTFHELKTILSGKGGTDSDNRNENLITYEINDMKDIDEAKQFWPELCVPKYLPEGYTLDKLVISKNKDNSFLAGYYFEKDEHVIHIGEIAGNEGSSLDMYADGEIITMSDREIFIWADPITEKPCINVWLGNIMIAISGDVSKEEMQMIAEQMQP